MNGFYHRTATINQTEITLSNALQFSAKDSATIITFLVEFDRCDVSHAQRFNSFWSAHKIKQSWQCNRGLLQISGKSY